MSAPPIPSLELWRGGVNTWECDEMGHMNVRFYVARAYEGLAGLAAALGLPGAFRRTAPSTLRVRDQHIRFIREARPRAALHMVGGLVELSESDALLFQLMIHSFSGEVAASFLTRVEHVTAAEGRVFPWSRRTRDLADALRVSILEGTGPRSLDLAPSSGAAGMAEADRLGLVRLGTGAVGPADCDVFGRARPEYFVGRISDGVPALGAALARGEAAAVANPNIGGAVLEYRISHIAPLEAGDRWELRSGLAEVGDKTQRLVHWILDPQTGRAWGSAQAVAIRLDLSARKIIGFTDKERKRLSSRVTAGLAF